MSNMKNLSIENAKIGFRNFRGIEKKFNPAGQRNFAVFLSEDDAEEVKNLGWNVKQTKPRDNFDPEYYLSVKVKFGYRPPNVWLITSRNKTKLDEDTVGMLDYAEISNIDIVIQPYEYDVNGKQGVTAYLKSAYVTIEEDEFASKYDVDDYSGPSNNEEVPF